MLAKGDVVIALSASGETEEILRLLEMLKRIGDALISFCCDMHSTLAQASDVALDCSVEQEACTLGLAPTASTTTMLALGDALAIAISSRKGFRAEDFANLHPGGKLGKRLMRVEQLMHSGDAVPRVAPKTAMTDVIYEMSRKGLGMTTVVADGKLVGLLSDGDLRRLLEKEGASALAKTAGEAMHPNPLTIAANEFAAEALRRMEERKITSLIVVDGEGRGRRRHPPARSVGHGVVLGAARCFSTDAPKTAPYKALCSAASTLGNMLKTVSTRVMRIKLKTRSVTPAKRQFATILLGGDVKHQDRAKAGRIDIGNLRHIQNGEVLCHRAESVFQRKQRCSA